MKLGFSLSALYARVSTAKDRGLQNPETQLRQLREFAGSQGWALAGEYVDRESGAKANRKQFAAMMGAASKRQFDVLLFWSLDRFSRGGIVPTLTDSKRLDGYGVRYRSYQEAVHRYQQPIWRSANGVRGQGRRAGTQADR